MRHREVQRLLLDVARQPRNAQFVESALKSSQIARQDLEKLGLIKQRDEDYVINFTLMTQGDVRLVRAVADKHAQSLTAALLDRRAEIDNARGQYPLADVDPKAVNYIVLGCLALDWDGLDVTAAKGYRAQPGKQKSAAYIPWAEEKSDLSLKGIYWGSHYEEVESKITLLSFGDHYSIPRYALPDLFWSLPSRAVAGSMPELLKLRTSKILRTSLSTTAREAGQMMLALRDGPMTGEELATAAGMRLREAKDVIALLVELQYVVEREGRYHPLIPVLDKRDRPMVAKLRLIGREVMEKWLATNYAHVREELQGLTPLRYGVPYAACFTQIWHYLFGTANRQLVEAGVFADPYADTRKYKGMIPAVWHPSISNAK
jgi:hypothetical protein